MKTGLWIALAALPLCACTPDYPRLPPLPAQAAPFTTGDAAFLQQANEHDLTQIALGKLAADHARAPEVKDLALTSVKDYEAHRATLATLASKHDMTLTDALLAKDQATLERLSKLHGPRFDSAYVTTLRDEAQTSDKTIVSASSTLKDGDLKGAAASLQKLDQSRISSAYSWLPQISTRKHRHSSKQ